MTLWQSMTQLVLGASMRAFGETVTLRPGKEFQQDLLGVFRAAHAQVDLQLGAISTVEPELGLRLSDVLGPALRQGEEVLAGGKRYRIRDTQPDGEGGVKLKLQRLDVT